MRFTEFISEMAKRVTPEQFSKWCVAKYGTSDAKALTIPQLRAVATEHDVQIPGYVYKQKVAGGKWDATVHSDTKDVPPPKDAPKAEVKKPSEEAKKAAVSRMAAELQKQAGVKLPKEAPKGKATDSDVKAALEDLFDTVRRGASSRDVHNVEKEGDSFVAEIRFWGNWEMPYDADQDDEDYDWEVLSSESKTKMKEIVKRFQDKYPKIKFEWSAEEKNWITFFARAA